VITGAPADPQAFVEWCADTQDVLTFKRALARVPSERWDETRGQVSALLTVAEAGRRSSETNAALRDRRARAVARTLKLEILQEVTLLRGARRESAAFVGPRFARG
jgi:hypothetical protein